MEIKNYTDKELFNEDFEKNIKDYCMNVYQLKKDGKKYNCILFVRYYDENAIALEVNDLIVNNRIQKRIIYNPYFYPNNKLEKSTMHDIMREVVSMRKEFYEEFYQNKDDNLKMIWTKDVNKINEIYNKFIKSDNLMYFVNDILDVE